MNCRCCSQAFSTGRTAQRASRKLMQRKIRKQAMPMKIQLLSRLLKVICSLEISA